MNTKLSVSATSKSLSSTPPGAVLQRQCACGNHTIAGGECSDCAKKQRMGTLQRSPMGLTINRPGDRYEQEAEQMAVAVSVGGALPDATRSAPALRRDAADGHNLSVAPSIVHDVLSSPGRPLDPATRAFMEPRFGQDFSGVRVHTDERAAESARAVSAHAYTVGRNVVFGAGQFQPQTSAGQRLMAHELTHVVQQNPGSSSAPGDRLQRAPDGNQLTPRDRQVACVVRLGGCASGTYNRDGGTADEHIPTYNKTCRENEKTNYEGPDITPSPQECNTPPKEPLSTGAKILLVAFFVAVAGAAIAGTVVAAEAVIPIVIASIVESGTTAYAFYLANAFVVNEIGLFAAGLLMASEGNIVGLLNAIATDPEQAVKIFAEVYILHTNISVNNGPIRPAKISVKLAPPQEQKADSGKILFKTVGPPEFEDSKTPQTPPSQAPKTQAPNADPPKAAPPPAAPKPVPPLQKPGTVLVPGMSTGEADEAAALKPLRSKATLLGEKAGGYDAHVGGQKIINSEVQTKDKDGNPIIVRDITLKNPDDAIQIKTITQIDKFGQKSTKPLTQLVADNVSAALKKAYNQPVTRARARTPLPGTNIYERTNVEGPKKITIIVQVPGEVTDEMRDAAAKVLAKDTSVAELPPIEVIVQPRQVETQ